jgi:hypothetical protein
LSCTVHATKEIISKAKGKNKTKLYIFVKWQSCATNKGYAAGCLKRAAHRESKKHKLRNTKHEEIFKKKDSFFSVIFRALMKREECSMKHDETCFTVIEPHLRFASASLVLHEME